jgi:hypothetical protein
MAHGLTFLTVEHAHSPVEDCNGHKNMRMDSIARLQRKTPLKQVRSRPAMPLLKQLELMQTVRAKLLHDSCTACWKPVDVDDKHCKSKV